MGLTQPTLTNLFLKFNASFTQLGPLVLNQSVSIPVNFDNLTFLTSLNGSYTPNNDVFTVANITAANDPNFFVFLCDGVANFAMNNGKAINSIPVFKCLFWSGKTLTTPGELSSIVLDGRVGAPFGDMLQGQAVNWELYYGNATIS